MEKRHVKQFRVPSGGTMPPGSLRKVPQVAFRSLSPPRVHLTLAFALRTCGLRRFTSPCLRGPPQVLLTQKRVNKLSFASAPPPCWCYVSASGGCVEFVRGNYRCVATHCVMHLSSSAGSAATGEAQICSVTGGVCRLTIHRLANMLIIMLVLHLHLHSLDVMSDVIFKGAATDMLSGELFFGLYSP